MSSIFTTLQKLAPQHALSRLAGHVASSQSPILKSLLINQFSKIYKVDLSEAQRSDPADYKSFNDFFTRTLAPDARPMVDREELLACPADGQVSQAGRIEQGQLLQATFWGALTAGRLVAVPLSTAVAPITQLAANAAGCVGATAWMVLKQDSPDALWYGTAVFGASMASCFPSVLTLAQQYVKLSGCAQVGVRVARPPQHTSGRAQAGEPSPTGRLVEPASDNTHSQSARGTRTRTSEVSG